MPPRTVLILGANGRFGQAAVHAFAAAGWRVFAQARRVPAALPAGAAAITLPLENPSALAAAAAGTTLVIHAVNPAYTAWDRELLPLASHGLAVAEHLDAIFAMPDNIYAFGKDMPPMLDERTSARPSTDKGRLREQLTGTIQARCNAGRLRAFMIRAGDFYGCGVGSWLDLVIAKSLPAGRLVYPGPLDVPHAWAYLPDLARTFVAVAEAAAPPPSFEVFHFAGHTLTGAALLDAIEAAADELGLTPAGGWRRGGMPWGLIRLLGLVSPMLRAITEMRYLWQVPHRLDGTRLAERTGPLPETPLVIAVRQALVDLGFGAHGRSFQTV